MFSITKGTVTGNNNQTCFDGSKCTRWKLSENYYYPSKDIRGQALFIFFRTVCFNPRFKNSGDVITFLRPCGLQNTDQVMPDGVFFHRWKTPTTDLNFRFPWIVQTITTFSEFLLHLKVIQKIKYLQTKKLILPTENKISKCTNNKHKLNFSLLLLLLLRSLKVTLSLADI